RGRAVPAPAPRACRPAPAGALACPPPGGTVCVVNLSAAPVELPAHGALLLASGPLDGAGRLPSDTAVWLGA
ncbi:DUF3459 domain-containing protein, partial [Streptomyces sp. NPDC059409]|uniref:DUF3459 domain-containing protein n=1 Tax=Streptomyces sp. NPDC059409 TaxID=3346824 RepID=UPI0036A24232